MEECVKTAKAAIHVNVNKAFMEGTVPTVGLYNKSLILSVTPFKSQDG